MKFWIGVIASFMVAGAMAFESITGPDHAAVAAALVTAVCCYIGGYVIGRGDA